MDCINQDGCETLDSSFSFERAPDLIDSDRATPRVVIRFASDPPFLSRKEGISLMKTISRFCAVACASILLATPALAGSYEEELAQLRAAFAKSDTNNDSKLTKEEAKAGGMTRLANNFSRVDTDRDGFVTLPQLEERLAARHK